jgi:hypothetical protein
METTVISFILTIVNGVYLFYTKIVKETLDARKLKRVEHSELITALMTAIDTTRKHMETKNLTVERVNRFNPNQMRNKSIKYDLPVDVVMAWNAVEILCVKLEYRDNNLHELVHKKVQFWRTSEEHLNNPEKMRRIATLSEMDEIYQQISEKLIPNN